MYRKFTDSISSIIRSDSAASTIVAVALLLGILAIFFMNIQVHFVPQWQEDTESVNMMKVCEDMSRLKSNVDILSTGMNIDPNSRNTLNTPIRMGSEELPLLQRTRPVNTLTLNPEGSLMYASITYNNSTTEFIPGDGLLPSGVITYRASNYNYVDQVYAYENGALIISQNNRSIIRLPPLISLEKGPGVINLSVDAICLKGNSETLSSNGVEDLRLRSRLRADLYDISGLESFYNITSSSLTIFTDYPEAWETYFTNLAESEELHHTDYDVTSNYDSAMNSYAVTLTLHPANKDLEVKIYKSMIDVEMIKW